MRRILLVIVALLLASAAMADDLVTLYIPVRLSHLHPSITQARIQCTLSGRDPATGSLAQYGPIPPKNQVVAITGGAYSGTVTLVFTNADFTPAQLAGLSGVNAGQCDLMLNAAGSWYEPYATSTGAVTGHATGSTFTNPVTFAVH